MAHTDHRQIEYLIYEYARRVDTADFEGVGALFDAGTFAAGDVALGGPELAGVLRSMVILYEGSPRTRHVTSNVAIEVVDDSATARSYFTVVQQVPSGGLETIIAGSYDDRFERIGDGWRFVERVVRSDLVGDISAHLNVNPFT